MLFVKSWKKWFLNICSNFALLNEILYKYQSGFKPNDSTVNKLFEIYNTCTIILNMNKGKDIRSVFCDISKAFDRVWHNGLFFLT